MIISHKYKYIFLKTYKVAGTSVEVYLSQFTGKNDIVTPISPPHNSHHPKNDRGLFNPLKEILEHNQIGKRKTFAQFLKREKYYNHIPGMVLKSRIPERIFDTYYKFCIERNPWDKVVSDYHMKKDREMGNLTFSEYIKEKDFPLNYQIYSNINNDNILVDKIVKYKYLNKELGLIFNDLGIPYNGELNIKAKSNHRKKRIHYSKYYNKIQEKVVEKFFRKEIELLGFEFEMPE